MLRNAGPTPAVAQARLPMGPSERRPGARWLDDEEIAAWVRLAAVLELLPAALDSQLRRDAGLTHFEYVERCFNKLKQWHGMAMRPDKTARSTTPRSASSRPHLDQDKLDQQDLCSSRTPAGPTSTPPLSLDSPWPPSSRLPGA